MEKVLVRNLKEAQVLDGALQSKVNDAFYSLTEASMHRYWRASKVWFNTNTNTFEYEDTDC